MSVPLRYIATSCAATAAVSFSLPRAYAKEPSPSPTQRVWMSGSKFAIPLGSLVDLDRPTPIAWFAETSPTWRAVTTGPTFGAALTGDGRLFVWSYDKDTNRYSPPRLVKVESGVTDIAATESEVIILTKDGRVVIMTASTGSTTSLASPTGDRRWWNFTGSPRTPFKAVSAGRRHIAMVDSRGRVWTAGDNQFGQCGREIVKTNRFNDAETSGHSNPVDYTGTVACVYSLEGDAVVSATCGGSHTVLLTTAGRALSFGDDSRIQLGLGDTRSQDKPDYVPHSGMGTMDGGTVSGDFSKLFSATLPSVKYSFYDRHCRWRVTDMKVPYITDVQRPGVAVAGDAFTLLSVGDAGLTVCCGENQLGQCGRGFNKQQQTFAPVKLPRAVKPTQISCGSNHCVASLEDGSVYAWGANSHGQLGSGSRAPACPPVAVHRSLIRGVLLEDIITTVGKNESQEVIDEFLADKQRDAERTSPRLVGKEASLAVPAVEEGTPSRLKTQVVEAIDKSRETLMMKDGEQEKWKPVLVHASFDNSVIVMTQ